MVKYLAIAGGLLLSATAYSQTDSAVFYQQKGNAEKQARRFKEAEKHFLRASQFDPKNTSVLIDLSSVLQEMNRYMEAREKLLAVERAEPNNLAVVEKLADLSVNLRKWEDLIRLADRMKQLGSKQSINFYLAKAHYELEHYGDALKYCELAFKEDPNKAETPYIAGRAFIEMSNYKRAAGCYEQAIERDSSNARWMYEAGLAYYAIPDDKKAIYWFERAGAKGYKKTNDYLENLGNAYLNTGQFDKGMNIMDQMLKNRPGDKDLMFTIGDAYYKAGKYQDAIDMWDRIFSIDAKNANALFMIGMAYIKKGEKEKGQQLCDKAIELDPGLAKQRTEKKMPNGL